MRMKKFKENFYYKLIYIFEIPDDAHKGLLKIGDTTIKINCPVEKLSPNCKLLNKAANKRIKKFTNTAGINFILRHTEIAAYKINDTWQAFRDYDVHRVLLNSNVKKKFPNNTTGREWFKVNLETARQAINAVKNNLHNLSGTPSEDFFPIILRPEQEDAVQKTLTYFKKGKNFLWNAKMRFGKTLSALEVVRRMKFSKTIVITHRPVVDVGWYEDFKKIFHGVPNYLYGSKSTGYKQLDELLNSGKNFVYFASLQDLRGSDIVGGKFFKNNLIFNTDWDFVIVDEAHEGTTTALGDTVIKNIVKPNSKFLALSGTPFNILDDYEDNVYTWDYISEQRCKADWEDKNFGDSNPYAELPQMNIFTYNLGDLLKNAAAYVELEDKAFNFREFFRTDDDENFVHEDDVKSFLNLLVKRGDDNYPYSNEEYRNIFRHSLWIIPGVKEGRALSKLLKNHDVFQHFKIVNVAGNGDADEESADALEKVKNAIAENDYTITLSCGKLTAGVTVPEWTAVFMLAGSFSTSAANYLQTIFRVQSPCNIDGKFKENCYVFDFAPDRTLKVIAESAAVSARAGKTDNNDRIILREFLNYCPIIAVQGSNMQPYDTGKFLRQLKRAYAERAVKNGFDDKNLYNDELLRLDELDIEKFNNLKKIVGASKAQQKIKSIDINSQGFTNEEYEKIRIAERKPARERTAEEIALLEEVKRKNKLKSTAISILRGISIRMPLLIYGANIPLDDDFKIEMLLDDEIVDPASWQEFMPAGVTKELFKDFIKYYDPEVFVEAGHRIRNRAKSADELTPTERVKKIAALFATFKNPDKETVLTPFRVVNLHVSSAFGGWNFFDEQHENILDSPRYVDSPIFNPNAKILEINSKTGLYPLYVTYSIYRSRLGNRDENSLPLDELQKIWDDTVSENIFVICKTPMAKAITKRTLAGFRKVHVNAHYFQNLINTLKFESNKFVQRIKQKSFWQKGAFGTMEFDAVVGNPPYQVIIDGDNKNFAAPIYHEFLNMAFKLADKISLIHPARFLFNAGATPDDFTKDILNDEHFKVVKYFPNAKDLFPAAEIKGGIAITYRDINKNFGKIGIFIPYPELKSIHDKVTSRADFQPLTKIMYSRTAYSLTEKAHKDFPNAKNNFSKGNHLQMSSNVFDLFPEIFFDDKPDDGREYIQIYGLEKRRRVFKFVRRDYVTDHESLEKFKVFVPDSNSAGALGEVVSTMLVGLPLVGCTQTFITVGAFDTRAEAEACIQYIRGKFCRVMLGILKVTQHNPPQTWAKVPLQDFTSNSDIDWTVSVAEIDAQLYKKYNLSDEEINFIESKVRAMS